MRMSEGSFYETLKDLVDAWHEVAENFEGYKSTTDEGDGIQLDLLVNRTRDGDLRLQVMASKDNFSTHMPLRPGDPHPDEPSVPYAEVVIRKDG